MQVCKPGSVSFFDKSIKGACHLSSPDFTVRIHRSTHPGILPKAIGTNRTSSSLPEAYLIFQPIRFAVPPSSLSGRWALTPPFHPSHLTCSGYALCQMEVCFLWHFLSADPWKSASFPLGSMALYVARTFLFPGLTRDSDKPTCTLQSTLIFS
ncbi:hypothetical protein Aoki45_07580 [Algoriphagus sp. oki45]|nr:hypothetical protein Aoki45_07580 [Algoriphagus sp. oki45]